SDVLASVLRQEIDWDTLPAATPPRIRALLRRCLTRDVKQRLQAIGEARVVLERVGEPSAAEGDDPSTATPGRGMRNAWAWGIAALLLVGWSATAIVLSRRLPDRSNDLKVSLALPEGLDIPTRAYLGKNSSLATLAVASSGDQVAFVGLQGGDGALYLRRFDDFDPVRLTNTDGATAPFFSPDGKRLAFFARGRLWRIDLPGGVPVDLGVASAGPVGGSWTDDDQIVYTPSYADALMRVPAGGGEARALTKVDRAAGEVSHRWPCVLPGGAGVLFTIKSASNETLDEARIAIADLATGAHRVLVEGGSTPRYLDDGRLVFARAGRLYAVGFDLASLSIRGAPVPVLEGVATEPTNGAAWYDVSRQGLLVYVAGGKSEASTRFSWEGPGRPAEVLERLDLGKVATSLRLSRDFKRAVLQVGGANDKLWMADLE